jgi:hypothetical protein
MVMATPRRSSTEGIAPSTAVPLMRSTTAPVKTTVTVGGFGTNSVFGNSKFFQKRLASSAVKIQALCRAFLVQARIFRQSHLEPRLHDLKDVETRKVEELRRITEQLHLEKDAAQAQITQEMEASEGVVEALRKEVDDYTKANEELKVLIKPLKRRNKELQQENTQHRDAEFKLQIQSQRLAKEIKANEEIAARYQYALEDGNLQKQELETALMRVAHQRAMLKKTIGKILKMVEEKVNTTTGGASPPASPRRGRRPDMSKTKSTKKIPSRANSAEEVSKKADYNWAHASYIMEFDHKNNDSSDSITMEPDNNEHKSNRSGAKKRGSGKAMDANTGAAAFDWSTQSYNWGNKSIQLHDTMDKIREAPKGSRGRRHSDQIDRTNKSHRPPHHKSSSSKADGSMRDLLQELKAIKKELKQ